MKKVKTKKRAFWIIKQWKRFIKWYLNGFKR